MTAWVPDELGVVREGGGPIGGDVQVSDQWSVRFLPTDQPADGRFAMVTSYWFVDNYDDDTLPVEFDDQESKTYGIQNVTEFLICTDLDNPGGTEVWSDYQYDTDDPRSFDTIEAAEQAAETAARSELSMNGITWDGRTTR